MGPEREEEEIQNCENRRVEEKENAHALYLPIPSPQNPSPLSLGHPWLRACHRHLSVTVAGGWPRLQSGTQGAGPTDCFLAASTPLNAHHQVQGLAQGTHSVLFVEQKA